MANPLIKLFTGQNRMEAEMARLEAFLSAFPGEYCAFSTDGTIIASAGFYGLLDVDTITSLGDVLAVLRPSDSVALESMISRFQEGGTGFSLVVQPVRRRDQFLRLHMTRGFSPGASHGKDARFDLLWCEDVSSDVQSRKKLENEMAFLSEENERLKAAFDSLPSPLWIRSEQGALVWCNQTYAATVGKEKDDIIEQQYELPLKNVAANKTTDLKTLAENARASGDVQSMMSHAILRGARRLLRIQEMPVAQLPLTIGMAQDITREEELESTQKRHIAAYRELLENLQAAIAIFDADQRLEFFNAGFAYNWGLEDTWLNAKPKLGDILEKLREQRRLPEQTDFRSYKQGWLNYFTNLIGPHQDMLYLPSGSVLRVLVIPHPLGGLMMIFEDVTSRLELESSYNTLVAVQKETLDNLAEGVAVFGGDGRLKLWNPMFTDLWELPPELVDDQPHISRLTEDMKKFFTPENWEQESSHLISQALVRSEKTGLIRRADEKLIAYASVSLPDGGVLITHVDVTDTVRVQEALEMRTQALEEAERVKVNFLANVSYQLRTPLNALIGFNEILDQEYFGPLNTKQKEYTDGMREAGSKLQSLIDAILDLTTMDAGFFALSKETYNARILLDDVLDLAEDWVRGQGLSLSLDTDKNLGNLDVDGPRLKQALLHLIQHSISTTPNGGSIRVHASHKPEGFYLRLENDGTPITPEQTALLFEPFSSGRTDADSAAARADNFSGLGLTLVRKIIELHGGTINALTELETGNGFEIKLP